MRVLIDTSVIIDYLRVKNKISTLFYKALRDFDPVLSLITVTELYSGKSAYTKEGVNMLNDLLAGCEILLPDLNLAKKAGELRMKYNLGMGDAYIAALALIEGLKLVTLDRVFNKIPGIKIHSIN